MSAHMSFRFITKKCDITTTKADFLPSWVTEQPVFLFLYKHLSEWLNIVGFFKNLVLNIIYNVQTTICLGSAFLVQGQLKLLNLNLYLQKLPLFCFGKKKDNWSAGRGNKSLLSKWKAWDSCTKLCRRRQQLLQITACLKVMLWIELYIKATWFVE